MRPKRGTGSVRLIRPAPLVEVESPEQTVERLRRERLLYDDVTGLPIHPFEEPARAGSVERIEHLGVLYIQIGRFFGYEELYGWEQYDRVLAVVAEGLRQDVAASRLAEHLLSIRFSGADSFYVLFNLPPQGRTRWAPLLDAEAARLQSSAMRRLRETFGGTTVDLVTVHSSSLSARDNPRARPSRHLIRTLGEAAKIVSRQQTREKVDLYAGLKTIIGSKQLKVVFQPVCRLADGGVVGYEALIRGPQGTSLELPGVLFAVAHENDLGIELESLCLETIFSRLPRGLEASRLFVNASSTLLRHPVFLDSRNLNAINRSHADVVVEISEKEMVGDYTSFREILEVVRRSKLKIAIDDAGSGYSGLETILYLRPDYIKVADSLVRGLETDPIKQEIIASLAAIGHRIGASLVAEGIERPEERDALVSLGVELGQGYLLGRPSAQLSRRRANGH